MEGGVPGRTDLVGLNFDATADLQDAVCDAEAGGGADAGVLLARLKEAVGLLQEREGEVLRVVVHGNELAAALADARAEVSHLRAMSRGGASPLRLGAPAAPEAAPAPTPDATGLLRAALDEKHASLAALTAQMESRDAVLGAWSDRLQEVLKNVAATRQAPAVPSGDGCDPVVEGLTTGIERLVDAWGTERRESAAAVRNTLLQEAAHKKVLASYESLLADQDTAPALLRRRSSGRAAPPRSGSHVPTSKTTGTNTSDLKESATCSSATNTDAAAPSTAPVHDIATSPGLPPSVSVPDAKGTIQAMKTNLQALEDRLTSFALRGSPARPPTSPGCGDAVTPPPPPALPDSNASALHAGTAALRDELDALREDLELGQEEAKVRAAEVDFLQAHIRTLHETIAAAASAAAAVGGGGDGGALPPAVAQQLHTLQLLAGPLDGATAQPSPAAAPQLLPLAMECSRDSLEVSARTEPPQSFCGKDSQVSNSSMNRRRGLGTPGRGAMRGGGLTCDQVASLLNDSDGEDISELSTSNTPVAVRGNMIPLPSADSEASHSAWRALAEDIGVPTVPCSYDNMPSFDPIPLADVVVPQAAKKIAALDGKDEGGDGGHDDHESDEQSSTPDLHGVPVQGIGLAAQPYHPAEPHGVEDASMPNLTYDLAGGLDMSGKGNGVHVAQIMSELDASQRGGLEGLLCTLLHSEQRLRGEILKLALRAWELQAFCESRVGAPACRALSGVATAAGLREYIRKKVLSWSWEEQTSQLRDDIRKAFSMPSADAPGVTSGEALAARNQALFQQWVDVVGSFTAAPPHDAEWEVWDAVALQCPDAASSVGLCARKRSRSAPPSRPQLTITSDGSSSPGRESPSGDGSVDSPVAQKVRNTSYMTTTSADSEWSTARSTRNQQVRNRQLQLDTLQPPRAGPFQLGPPQRKEEPEGMNPPRAPHGALLTVDIFDVSSSKNRSRSAPSKRRRESVVTIQTCSSVSEAPGSPQAAPPGNSHSTLGGLARMPSSGSNWSVPQKALPRQAFDLDALMPARQTLSPGSAAPDAAASATPSTPEMSLRYPPGMQRLQPGNRERERIAMQRQARARGGGGMLAFQLPPSPKAKVKRRAMSNSHSPFGTFSVFPMEEELVEELCIPHAESFICGAFSDSYYSQSVRTCSPLTPLINPSRTPGRTYLQRPGPRPSPGTSALGGLARSFNSLVTSVTSDVPLDSAHQPREAPLLPGGDQPLRMHRARQASPPVSPQQFRTVTVPNIVRSPASPTVVHPATDMSPPSTALAVHDSPQPQLSVPLPAGFGSGLPVSVKTHGAVGSAGPNLIPSPPHYHHRPPPSPTATGSDRPPLPLSSPKLSSAAAAAPMSPFGVADSLMGPSSSFGQDVEPAAPPGIEISVTATDGAPAGAKGAEDGSEYGSPCTVSDTEGFDCDERRSTDAASARRDREKRERRSVGARRGKNPNTISSLSIMSEDDLQLSLDSEGENDSDKDDKGRAGGGKGHSSAPSAPGP